MKTAGGKGCRPSEGSACFDPRMERFMEPCLLYLLLEKPGHGYELLERLGRFGFEGDPADAATLYRTLRRMEKEKKVSSRWYPGSSGPARRLYEVTAKGEKLLHKWAASIREKRARMDSFLNAYNQKFG